MTQKGEMEDSVIRDNKTSGKRVDYRQRKK
jgi:hypothetical protein